MYEQCSTDYHKQVKTLFTKQVVDKGKVVLLWRKEYEYVTGRTINNDRPRERLKPFHVTDPDEVISVHDQAPCMRANKTQHLLPETNIKFLDNDIWPGNSPDLNVTERIGSIIKNEVEKKMLSETEHNRYREDILEMYITNVLANMETDADLFETLLRSYPSHICAVKNVDRWSSH